jgi:hypothetical protein
VAAPNGAGGTGPATPPEVAQAAALLVEPAHATPSARPRALGDGAETAIARLEAAEYIRMSELVFGDKRQTRSYTLPGSGFTFRGRRR